MPYPKVAMYIETKMEQQTENGVRLKFSTYMF